MIGHLLSFYHAAARSSHSLMRWRIATASARCSLVITALLVSQFSAVSDSCAAKALRITDDDWARSSGLSKPAMSAHPQRAGADARFVNALGGSIHIVTVTPFRGPKSGS